MCHRHAALHLTLGLMSIDKFNVDMLEVSRRRVVNDRHGIGAADASEVRKRIATEPSQAAAQLWAFGEP